MTRVVALVVLIVTAAPAPDAMSQVNVRGVVRSEAGEGIAAAHVVIDGSSTGTITNSFGQFEIIIPRLPAVLEVRHIGFQTARLRVESPPPGPLFFTLQPSVYALDEIIVAERNFAENVMRRVIQKKQSWSATLGTYAARGYSRITLENESDVVSIHEATFDLHGSRTSYARVLVRSIRETSTLHEQLGLQPAGWPIPNFYADSVSIRGRDFVGPTHPDALSYYTFAFGRTRSMDSLTVYDIYVAPRTERYAALIGVISVVAEHDAMIGAQLRPARFVEFPPPTVAWDVFYRQQYFEVAGAWMPADLHVEGSFVVRSRGTDVGPVQIEQTSLLESYAPTRELPELLARTGDRLVLDTESIEKDYLFAEGSNIVPLTPREVAAIIRLRQKPIALAEAYPPRRSILSAAGLRPAFPLPDAPQFDWPRFGGYQVSAGLNRVDGYRLGIGTTWRLPQAWYLEWRLSQAYSLDRVRYHAKATRLLSERIWISGGYAVDSEPLVGQRLYPGALTSLATQLGAPDYFDYHWSRAAHALVGYRSRHGELKVDVRSERSRPLESRLDRAWPFERALADNAVVDSMRITTVSVTAGLGQRRVPFRSAARNGVTVRVEQFLEGSDSAGSFTVLRVEADGYLPTFYRSRLEPNGLHVRLTGGAYRGDVPPQKYGTIESTLRAFGTIGTLRGLPESPQFAPGYVGLFWEHDFRGIPFEWFGLSGLSDSGVGLRLTGAHARTWMPENTASRGPLSRLHHELGLSLTNPFGLPLRLDTTVRLNDGAVFFGFGVGRF